MEDKDAVEDIGSRKSGSGKMLTSIFKTLQNIDVSEFSKVHILNFSYSIRITFGTKSI